MICPDSTGKNGVRMQPALCSFTSVLPTMLRSEAPRGPGLPRLLPRLCVPCPSRAEGICIVQNVLSQQFFSAVRACQLTSGRWACIGGAAAVC